MNDLPECLKCRGEGYIRVCRKVAGDHYEPDECDIDNQPCKACDSKGIDPCARARVLSHTLHELLEALPHCEAMIGEDAAGEVIECGEPATHFTERDAWYWCEKHAKGEEAARLVYAETLLKAVKTWKVVS
jgi:hypothetical protein